MRAVTLARQIVRFDESQALIVVLTQSVRLITIRSHCRAESCETAVCLLSTPSGLRRPSAMSVPTMFIDPAIQAILARVVCNTGRRDTHLLLGIARNLR
jgi:hypothetical protein